MNDNVHPVLKAHLDSLLNLYKVVKKQPSETTKEMIRDFQSKDFFATIYEEPEDEYNEDDEWLAEQEHRWEADNDR